jgi:hypothetical protein
MLLAWLLLESRMIAAFPIAAIDGPARAFRQSWALTARYWPRIFLALFLASLPFSLRWASPWLPDIFPSTPIGYLLLDAWDGAYDLLAAAVFAALASHIYLRITSASGGLGGGPAILTGAGPNS